MLSEMQAFLDDPSNGYHCYYFGVCTAYRSPGFFASVKTRGGTETQHTAEGATIEEALRKLLDLMRPQPVTMTTRPQMPGMTRRMPGC
jgi:hypothetical protein